MRRARVSVSSETNKGASFFMAANGKRHPNDTPHVDVTSMDRSLDEVTHVDDSKVDETISNADPYSVDPYKADPYSVDPYKADPYSVCPMPINIVDKNIYIGNHISAGDLNILKNYGITHIINTAAEIPNYFENYFKYTRLELLDDPSKKEDLSKVLEPTYRNIIHILNKEPTAKILIHCHAGKSRSATLVIYYLMRSREWSFEKAKTYLKNIRWIVEPNSWYTKILNDISDMIKRRPE